MHEGREIDQRLGFILNSIKHASGGIEWGMGSNPIIRMRPDKRALRVWRGVEEHHVIVDAAWDSWEEAEVAAFGLVVVGEFYDVVVAARGVIEGEGEVFYADAHALCAGCAGLVYFDACGCEGVALEVGAVGIELAVGAVVAGGGVAGYVDPHAFAVEGE